METLIGHPLLPADCVDSNGKYTQQRHDMILALHTSTHGSSHWHSFWGRMLGSKRYWKATSLISGLLFRSLIHLPTLVSSSDRRKKQSRMLLALVPRHLSPLIHRFHLKLKLDSQLPLLHHLRCSCSKWRGKISCYLQLWANCFDRYIFLSLCFMSFLCDWFDVEWK